MYLYLDTLEEGADYQFALLAQLKRDTPDGVRAAIDEQIEDLIQKLEENDGFTLAEDEHLSGNAERDYAVTVAQLTKYMKVNLDYLSLRDADLGPNPPVGDF